MPYTTLESGEGHLVSTIHPPPVQCNIIHKVDNTCTMTAVTFWKNGSITSHVLWEINSVCVDTQLKSIRLTCIISGTEDDLCKFILRATKTWVVACK